MAVVDVDVEIEVDVEVVVGRRLMRRGQAELAGGLLVFCVEVADCG